MYEAETAGILVRAEPQYLADESDPEDNRFVWAYTIEVENCSRDPVQLLSRFWRITDANGLVQEVRGAGVVGQQPVIPPGQCFRYTSACPLAAPSGMMEGSYAMIRVESGEEFDITIPLFALDSPHSSARAN